MVYVYLTYPVYVGLYDLPMHHKFLLHQNTLPVVRHLDFFENMDGFLQMIHRSSQQLDHQFLNDLSISTFKILCLKNFIMVFTITDS